MVKGKNTEGCHLYDGNSVRGAGPRTPPSLIKH